MSDGSKSIESFSGQARRYEPPATFSAKARIKSKEEYDKLYDKIRVMPPSEERTRIYEKMRDMVIEDAPFAGSMARTRFVLAHSRLKNFKPTEIFAGWVKYLDVDASVR